MQPYLFPYIGYWQLIHAVDVFVIYDDVNYIKGGWINRNYILERGARALFTLETNGASSNQLINQISVGKNAEKLIKTLRQNYIKAPYFDATMNLLTELLMNDEDNLARFVSNTIRRICSYLMIETQLMISSEVFSNTKLRNAERVLDICNQLKTDIYINASGGISLYRKDEFANKGIKLLFIKTEPVVYTQFANGFVPNLSIIDLLMFNPIERIQGFLKMYEFE